MWRQMVQRLGYFTGQSENGSVTINDDSSLIQEPLTLVDETPPEAGKKLSDVGHDETLPEAGKKGNDAGHGNRFQYKLLMLYVVRAINFGYQFYLGTELPDVGDKFDDLIFHYKDENDVNFRQQYLQAKHRLSENKKTITGKQTNYRFNENSETNLILEQHLTATERSDFSLLKYFLSYIKIIRDKDIEYCIICTNTDFHQNDLKKNGIELDPVEQKDWPKMLDCNNIKKNQKCYKLKMDLNKFKRIPSERKKTWVKNCTKEDIKWLFENCSNEQMKSFFVNFEAGVEVNETPFSDYIADEDPANVFDGFLMRFFDDFLKKLIFVVKMPNEDELDEILAKEVGEYFKLSSATLQSAFVMKEMVNWFKKQENHWLTAKEAKEILEVKLGELMSLSCTTLRSLDYQHNLKQSIEFNESAVEELKIELNSFWNNSPEKIKYFYSKTPILTAVKVFSAVKKLPEFPNKDDYRVISSKCLQEDSELLEKWKTVEKCYKLLIIVDEDASNFHELAVWLSESPFSENSKKKIVLISNQHNYKLDQQEIRYEDFSEKTKELFGMREVLFQETLTPVNQLIDKIQAKKVITSHSIEIFMQTTYKTISVPSYSSSVFRESLYIERKLKFQLQNQLLNRPTRDSDKNVNNEFHIESNGRIKWLFQDQTRKNKVWGNLKVHLLERSNYLDDPLSKLFETSSIDASSQRIIITGVAGMGKSTTLSHYYNEIKKKKPDNLVIKISLMNYRSALLKLKEINKNSMIEFLTGIWFDQSAFARSLLKHRLETGDRITLMLDGFDEIDSECQDKVVELVKNLNESIPLYITTRSHLADKLQLELSQLAYSLVKFTKEDQIKYLTLIWEDYFKQHTTVKHNPTTIFTSFATHLIDRVTQDLNDQEKEFIGIPLQCRILAECFQAKITDKLSNQNPADDVNLSHLLDGQQFDLANLYKLMIKEKRRVFRKEKIKVNYEDSHIVNNSIEDSIEETERHLRKLAIVTIVNEDVVDDLIPSVISGQSETERKKKEKKSNENGIRFGLLDWKNEEENEVQFLHRTYAEYLVADYIFNGFLLDEEKHNNLLEKEPVRKWIIEKMLVESNYQGVRVFFDSMLKKIILQEKWKNGIVLNFPVGLKKFIALGNELELIGSCLVEAFVGGNANILLYIFDCFELKVNYKLSEIRSKISESIRNPSMQRPDVFDRILNYFNDGDDDELIDILKKFKPSRPRSDRKLLIQKNVERFLDFVDFHKDQIKLNHKIASYESFLRTLTNFFVYYEHGCLREKYFQILSLIYPDDSPLTKCMRKVILASIKSKDWQSGAIEKTLSILQCLGRNKVLPPLYQIILVAKSETFQKDEKLNIRSFLETMELTDLLKATVCGDLKEIGSSLEVESYVKQTMVTANEDDEFSLLHVAAAYGHEEICQKIFVFFPEFIDKKGLIFESLQIAIKLENVVMVKTFLKSIKAVWGQKIFVEFLNIVLTEFDVNIYLKEMGKRIANVMANIVAENENDGYKDLNDLVFKNTWHLHLVKHVERDHLQGMIDAEEGFHVWMNRLMDISPSHPKIPKNVKYGFGVLSSNDFLDRIGQLGLIPKLIDIIISNQQSSSYWSQFATHEIKSEVNDFLECAVKTIHGDDLKRLLLARDRKNNVIFFKFLVWDDRDCFDRLLYGLPDHLKKIIQDLWKQETSGLIEDYHSSPTFPSLR